MGLWSSVRDLAGGSRGRIVRALTDVHREERRLARQLHAHADSVPYAYGGERLREIGSHAAARAELIANALTGFRAAIQNGEEPAIRGGRNYWHRLTADLEDLRAVTQQYRELAHKFDADYPETTALLWRLAHDAGIAIREISELIALSDPHAAD